MVDRYTKSVLTVIAAALVGLLAIRVGAALTPAAYAQGSGCGGSPTSPCYVTGANVMGWPIPVKVQQ
jgi:hypothetical protein